MLIFSVKNTFIGDLSGCNNVVDRHPCGTRFGSKKRPTKLPVWFEIAENSSTTTDLASVP
jgi:hypothetical protein